MKASARVEPTKDVNERIAARVRALRAEQSYSLDMLATRSGVSRSMISLIERGKSSPTAVVLEKIAGAFNLPLAALFDDPQAAPGPVARAADRSGWRDPASGYVRRNLSPPNHPGPLQLVEVELPPGARVAYESSPRAVRIHQQIWVQEGRLEVGAGDTTYSLSQDDCLAMNLDAPTTFHNPGRKSARYLVAIVVEAGRRGRP